MAQPKKQNNPAPKPAAATTRSTTPPKASAPKVVKKSMDTLVLLSIILGVIAFLLYANTLNLGYALDDFTVIKNNSIVTKGISAIPEILATPYRRGWFITNNDLYRPLSLVMFAAEYQFGGGEPGAGHLMNILVYAGCVIMLFRFVYRFFDGQKVVVAFIAALLFAVHPVHTEVVANIKSRDELLCFFFAFLSLNVYLKYMKSGKMQQLLLASLCFMLSYLSKETVISFLFVIPFVFFMYRNENRQRSIFITASAVLVTVAFLAVRFAVLRHYDANTSSEVSFIDNFLTVPPSQSARFATAILILGKYLQLLVVPAPLMCDYCFNSIPFVTFGNVWVIISLLAYLAMSAFGIYRLIKKPKDPYAFAILFFLSTIALFSNIPFLIGAAMAERFIFFASVGFCMVIALLVEQFLVKKDITTFSDVTGGKVLAVLVPVAAIFAFLTVGRNADWADNYTLFKADVPKNENNSRLNYYLGTEIVATLVKSEGNPVRRRELIDEAIPYLRKSLAIYPEYTDANASLGDAFFQIGQYDSAEYYDKRSLATNPKFTVAINNLAGVYFMQKQYGKALEVCRKAIVLNPNYVNAYSNMGLCYMNLRQFDSSLFSLYKAISLDPSFKSAYENMALTYRAIGNADSVRKYEALAKP
jgi:tetratricopeptide (TPR) repeat protein